MSQSDFSAQRAPQLLLSECEQLRAQVDARLERHFRESASEDRLTCAIRHGLLSPGKRVRPLITLLACRQAGAPELRALDAACAVEMVHAASLIMDDLPSMDDARMRRGCLATHVVFGEGAAMLAAVALLNEAYRIVAASADVDGEAKLRAIAHLADAIGLNGLAGGQDRDIACGKSGGGAVSLKEMEQRHLEKTGALFSAAAAIGAEIAEASPETVSAFKSYGCHLGLAFQAFDDVVDVACTSEVAGKDVAQDQDKSTVVSLLGADGARIAAERHLERAIQSAESVNSKEPAVLAVFAQTIGEKFHSLTQ